ncbi:MAG: hypothetical protein H0U19_01660 [Acidobacteria bacterium]|nr:hypothetical protein [Acidobacteriota bacterium]
MGHRVISGVAALVLAAGLAAPVHAQDAKAAEVLTAARKAIGNGKLDGLKTFSLQAAMRRNVGSMQMQSDIELLVEMPDKYMRSDVSSGMMNMTMSTGFNGGRAILPTSARAMPGGGGMMITMGGAPGAGANPHGGEKPTSEQMEQLNRTSLRSSRQEISRLMLGWFGTVHPSLTAQYAYVGEAESPDGKAHVIDVKDADGFAARLFIDQISKLPLMVTYQGRQPRMVTMTGPRPTTGAPGAGQAEAEARKQAQQPAPMIEFSIFFEDWHEADGVNFPHKIRRASAGETNEEWTISKVKVNPKIDPNRFAVEAR